MDIYRIYLLAYERATRGESAAMEGASLQSCAAVALACYDAKHDTHPRRGSEVISGVAEMCMEAKPCA